MQNHQGMFVVLESSNESIVSSQLRLLDGRLKAIGHEVVVFNFPRHSEASSHFVRNYLNGSYGPISAVSPYTAVMFYALDRFEILSLMNKAIGDGKVVIASGYVGSSMARQATKFSSLAEQRGFFMWADSLEYQLLGIPRPNINLILMSPQENMPAKQETNGDTAKKTEATYGLLCKLFPRDYKMINCARGGQILDIVGINEAIWDSLKSLLPQPKHEAKGLTISLDQPEATNGPETKDKQVETASKQSVDDKTRLHTILELQEQMLAKASSIKGIDQSQLRMAINLITPLETYKKQIESLVENNAFTKSPDNNEPASLDRIINKISGLMPTLLDNEGLKLIQAKPANEFEILSEAKSAGLNYQQKQQQLDSELKNNIKGMVYIFEAISDFSLLLAFRTEVDASKVKLLAASPMLGHKIPEIIEIANLDEPFNHAFEVSSKLYGEVTADINDKAIYRLLLGHNVRWKFEIDGGALSKALIAVKNKDLLSYLEQIRAIIAEHHPHVAKALADTRHTKFQKNNKKHR